MRKITEIIIHYSDSSFGDAAQIRDWHLHHPKIKFRDGAYHFVILNGVRRAGEAYDETIDGAIESLRNIEWDGAGVHNHHEGTLEVCLISDGKFSKSQMQSLLWFVKQVTNNYPTIEAIYGHNELEATDCPGFDVGVWCEENELGKI